MCQSKTVDIWPTGQNATSTHHKPSAKGLSWPLLGCSRNLTHSLPNILKSSDMLGTLT